MAFLAELDVDLYGCLDGDDAGFPVPSFEHDWSTPYPAAGVTVPFTWEPGEGKHRPDVYWYPRMRDWVCNRLAFDVLTRCAGPDIRTLAHGVLGDEPLFVVQVTAVIDDVVDREASLIDTYETYEALRFPAFRRSMADAVASRVFRVPGSVSDVFVGEHVRQALTDAGVTGLRFVRADWAPS
ncbi:hypothetical protein [Streptomyces sp. NPDC058572]|uniref:hypothetical protein n=1 Tax=Streptomyces sp. NPDC058572 TaxID=3346546 RepID=UPI00364B2CE6